MPERNEFGQVVGSPVPDWTPPPRPPRAPLVGRTCSLETLDIDRHAVDLFEANTVDADGSNWTYLPYGPFDTLESYRDWLAAACMGDDPHFHAVIDHRTGRAVGVASYLRINPASGSIEVGHINFSPRLQRTIAATEAMYLMMAQAFDLGYRRYEWKCNALNRPSRDAALRLGMSYEGVFRQALMSKGRNRDTAWYAAIDNDWPAIKRAFETWFNEANFVDDVQKTSLSNLTRPVLVITG